jgi:hypothetical protein
MSIYHELFGKIFPSNSGVVPVSADPELLRKLFLSDSGIVPMTAGHLPAYAYGRGRM